MAVVSADRGGPEKSFAFLADRMDPVHLRLMFNGYPQRHIMGIESRWPDRWPKPRCVAGHEGCTLPAGWDPEHSDQQTPYTLDQLAEREQPPHPGAYGDDYQEYLFGWKLWLTLRRDSKLRGEEYDVYRDFHDRRLLEKMAPQLERLGMTADEVLAMIQGKDRAR